MMLKITRLTTENLERECITDAGRPAFSFACESDREAAELKKAEITVGDWKTETTSQIAVRYGGKPLEPYTEYTVTVTATDNYGETAKKSMTFETGKMGSPFTGKFITDTSYRFKGKKVSPEPMTFVKNLRLKKNISRARLYVTAFGIYEFEINGKKAGSDYFAPGFTSYKNQLQYQVYDIKNLLKEENELVCTVAGGWASGKFTHCLRNRIFTKRQSLLAELRVEYDDGSYDIVGTDESWSVTRCGKFKEADFYDGEIYDAAAALTELRPAGTEKLKINPELIAAYGSPVRAHERLEPVSVSKTKSGKLLYDFGQNFAGVIRAEINGTKGKKIIFRHAEILMDGELFTKPLRTAKARAEYICGGGKEIYSPRLTYMGFRYVTVEGIDEKDIALSAFALYSDLKVTGSFSCSDERLNKLQQNIVWSAKSNFIDIPTDCPQRDERMGWTGDIALFSSTASFNFDTSRFYDKWLKDLRSDQNRTGGVPVTIPHVIFPSNLESVFTMAIDHWGDACILVPYAEYKARGDVELLGKMYPSMKKYLKACAFWAGLFSLGKHRKIWSIGHHYGDWCAPGIGLMAWMMRGKWTATACWAHSAGIVSEIAGILGQKSDEKYYKKLKEKISSAYRKIFTDGNGKLKKEFQTAYVLPLYYGVFGESEKLKAAANLAQLVKKNDYNIGTGFPGTPYVLFALCDNGQKDAAFKMLMKESCPSWLFQVKAGGTTIWERWDALREDGSSNTGASDGTHGMVSFNHYANGAVGDFLYRRIAGIEATEAGYKRFSVKPVIGGGITFASGSVESPYGKISVGWSIDKNSFKMSITVPFGAECEYTLPSNKSGILKSGSYELECDINLKGEDDEQ